jgi:hypothetical protein
MRLFDPGGASLAPGPSCTDPSNTRGELSELKSFGAQEDLQLYECVIQVAFMRFTIRALQRSNPKGIA